ncbi:four helix bundle protein [Luteibacter aegosomatissinici]|uniref:four helix bundle protein n=1 Tax=Luteibacter aegosomatissinici TaxID=2911539 RepID=UPI001FF8A6FD|nr:four helix bundle protein [Luteibacter aegosomatissinici]UPG92984.1 four helix bundle protein [Luteibacter aegosomatissinici]
MSRPHHDLLVWRRTMELAKKVYELTSRLPVEERFGLSSQLRRCAVSIPSNIAEGACRGSQRELLRFVLIARGSLGELETQLQLLASLGMAKVGDLLAEVECIFGLMGGLVKKLRTQTNDSQAASRRLTSRASG